MYEDDVDDDVRVSASFWADGLPEMAELVGARHHKTWPTGRMAVTTKISRVERATQDFDAGLEAVLDGVIEEVRTWAQMLGAPRFESGKLLLRFTFSPGIGHVSLSREFVSQWAALGGQVEFDVPLM
jgi:hypothetical protein